MKQSALVGGEGLKENRPVLAIGLDAIETSLMEKWMAQGHLPNLEALRTQGSYGYLNSKVDYAGKETSFSCTEPLWVMFSTGCLPEKTGFWSTIKYNQTTYDIRCDKTESGYDYETIPPFYALGDDYDVAVFDIPVSALSSRVNGAQILGWGGHFPFTPSHSHPPDLLPQIVDKHGENPVFHNDHGYWWSDTYRKWLEGALEESIDKRVDICSDLSDGKRWDLFITVFGDLHSAGHDFYHLSQAHPLHRSSRQKVKEDPLLAAYKRVDRAVGEIVDLAPEEAHVLCFSLHGMASNHQDTLSMMFLGEVLYRFNFPGKVGFAKGDLSAEPPPMVLSPLKRSWLGEMWRHVHDDNPIKRFASNWLPAKFQWFSKGDLESPYHLTDNISFIPALWYRPLWPRMRAFALPSFSDGHIRINLQGREAKGIVLPSEYDSLCDEIIELLYGLRESRTGRLIVKSVERTRRSPDDEGDRLPDADLVVVWHNVVSDVIEHPEVGRIGPITLFRPGGHSPQGFVMAKGPRCEPGSRLPTGQAVDLAPTILDLLGAPLPDYLDGESLLTAELMSAFVETA